MTGARVAGPTARRRLLHVLRQRAPGAGLASSLRELAAQTGSSVDLVQDYLRHASPSRPLRAPALDSVVNTDGQNGGAAAMSKTVASASAAASPAQALRDTLALGAIHPLGRRGTASVRSAAGPGPALPARTPRRVRVPRPTVIGNAASPAGPNQRTTAESASPQATPQRTGGPKPATRADGAPPAGQRATRPRGRGGPPSPVPGPFCPWCGAQARAVWRHCPFCGGRQPAAAAMRPSQALPAGAPVTASERILRLAAVGLPPASVAKVIGVRQQFVYTVLARARRRRAT